MAKKSVTVLTGVLAALLICACVVSPVLGVPLIPAVCALLFCLSRRWGAWPFAVAAAAYCVAGLAVNGYCAFSVAGAAVTASLAVPSLFRRKLSPLVQIALCAGISALVVCLFFGATALIEHCSVDESIRASYAALRRDPVLAAISQRYYRTLSPEKLGHVPYSPHDELYAFDARTQYAASVWRELDGTVWWYLSGFGVFAGGMGALGGFALSSLYGDDRAPAIKTLRLGREYLFAAVLPALAFSFLAFYEPMVPIVIAVVNVMITLPMSMCGITLLYHTVCRFNGKARIAAVVLFWAVMAVAAFFYEWGMLILGFVGLADSIANFRKLLDWALS